MGDCGNPAKRIEKRLKHLLGDVAQEDASSLGARSEAVLGESLVPGLALEAQSLRRPREQSITQLPTLR